MCNNSVHYVGRQMKKMKWLTPGLVRLSNESHLCGRCETGTGASQNPNVCENGINPKATCATGSGVP
jgi:hypothetical protein